MVVDIGGGTSEVAVISLGGIVVSQSIRVGGDELDESIMNYVKREYKLLIGQQTAEEVKLEIGSAYPLGEEVQAEIRGRDMVSGLPKTVVLTSEEIRGALEEPVVADHRRGQGDARPHPPRARLRHHGSWHHAGRRRLAASGARRAPAPRDADARAPGRVAADVRGGRLGEIVGGVRSDPPFKQEFTQPPPSVLGCLARGRMTGCHPPYRLETQSTVHDKQVRRRRAVLALLVAVSLILLTAYFGETPTSPLHNVQRGVVEVFSPVEAGRQQGPDPGPRRSPAGSRTRSTRSRRSTSCAGACPEPDRPAGPGQGSPVPEPPAEQPGPPRRQHRRPGLPPRRPRRSSRAIPCSGTRRSRSTRAPTTASTCTTR